MAKQLDSSADGSDYDYEFVPPLPEELICPICFSAMRDPVQTTICGHRFCRDCLETFHRSSRRVCPMDNLELAANQIFPDTATKRKILTSPLRCPNNGCEWISNLLEVDKHKKNCLFEKVTCTHGECSVQVLRKELNNHVKSECVWRTYECLRCRQILPVCKRQFHERLCTPPQTKFPSISQKKVSHQKTAEDFMKEALWFRPNLSIDSSAAILMSCGKEGAFIVRNSTTAKKSFSLSLLSDGKVRHVRIFEKEGCFNIGIDGERFESVFQLVEFYRTHTIELMDDTDEVPRKCLLTVAPQASDELEILKSAPWFHDNIDMGEASTSLRKCGKDGAFIVRKSMTKKGEYSLSLLLNEKVRHVRFMREDGMVFLGNGRNKKFASIPELVDFYRFHPMETEIGRTRLTIAAHVIKKL